MCRKIRISICNTSLVGLPYLVESSIVPKKNNCNFSYKALRLQLSTFQNMLSRDLKKKHLIMVQIINIWRCPFEDKPRPKHNKKKMTILLFVYFGTHNNKIHTIYKQTRVFFFIFSMSSFYIRSSVLWLGLETNIDLDRPARISTKLFLNFIRLFWGTF
jgi:hypothetical protein